MEDNCKNCGSKVAGNFCNNCGQKKFKRIDKKYLIDEMQYLLLHTNKGFFYSVKSIFKNPGKTAKEFIDGNRVNHYKPIMLAFVLSGLSTFISFKILNVTKIMEQTYEKQKIDKSLAHEFMSFLSSYNSLFMLLSIPIISIITYLLLKSWKNNYYEHIIMNAYIQCCYTIYCILFIYPILFFLKDSSTTAYMIISLLTAFSIPVIMVWFYKEFYPEKSIGDVIVKVVFFVIVGIIIYVTIIFAFVIGTLIMYGPEALLKLAPQQQ
ncbi:MAG TPA: DUF3667 domain-containing protein [Flavobacterium sp.]|jgi:hypothetical protein|nr:DUF3667 domain-containing protein [Flavobacterium sp.]